MTSQTHADSEIPWGEEGDKDWNIAHPFSDPALCVSIDEQASTTSAWTLVKMYKNLQNLRGISFDTNRDAWKEVFPASHLCYGSHLCYESYENDALELINVKQLLEDPTLSARSLMVSIARRQRVNDQQSKYVHALRREIAITHDFRFEWEEPKCF